MFTVDIEEASWIKSDGEKQLVLRWRAGGAAERRERRWAGTGYEESE